MITFKLSKKTEYGNYFLHAIDQSCPEQQIGNPVRKAELKVYFLFFPMLNFIISISHERR